MSYSGKFKDKNNNLHPVTSVLYGTCDTAAATAAKVVTCTDFDALMTGVTIRVKFANANTAASPTVNINSTGAKSVYRFGSTAPVDGNSWNAGEVVELVYDGTSFFMTGADDIAAKQNATDNSLETTDKTIVGAINEHEGDISTLKSGLTNLSEEVNGDATTYPYADVITIEDAIPANVADCSVKIEPVQDLHGYDHPWVGGAGSNQWDEDWESGAINGATGEKVLKDDKIRSKNYIAVTAGNNYYFVHESTAADLFFYDSNYQYLGYNDGHIVANTSMAFTVPSGASYMLFSILQTTYSSGIAINYPATVTSYAPYTNICPIIGHTECPIVHTGTNMCMLGTKSIDSAGYVINNNGINDIGGLPAGKYTISFDASGYASGAAYEFILRDTDNNSISSNSGSFSSSRISFTVTIADTAVRIMMYTNSSSGVTINNIQIEKGEEAHGYQPYAGKTYTIALGDTIYGGTVDFDSGVMTVDRAIADFTGVEWTYQSQYKRFRADFTGAKQPELGTTAVNAICSDYKVVSMNTSQSTNNTIAISAVGYNYIYVHDERYDDSTANDFATAMESVQFVYELATTTTIQLTPQQIQLLKGTNTITASTGQISVTVNGVSGSIGAVQEQIDDLQGQVAEVQSNLTSLHIHKVVESLTTGTVSDKLLSLKTAYNNLTADQRKTAILVKNDQDQYIPLNNTGEFFVVFVNMSTTLFITINIQNGTSIIEQDGTKSDQSSLTNSDKYSIWVME